MADLGSWLVFLHVLAAFWLAGGAFGSTVVRAQGRRARSPAEAAFAFRLARRLADVYTIPGWVVVGLLGIGAIHPRGWGFAFGWVHLSVGLWIVALGASLLFVRPWLGRVASAAEASAAAGRPTAELQKELAATAPKILADVDALAVVVIAMLMVFKPF